MTTDCLGRPGWLYVGGQEQKIRLDIEISEEPSKGAYNEKADPETQEDSFR